MTGCPKKKKKLLGVLEKYYEKLTSQDIPYVCSYNDDDEEEDNGGDDDEAAVTWTESGPPFVSPSGCSRQDSLLRSRYFIHKEK